MKFYNIVDRTSRTVLVTLNDLVWPWMTYWMHYYLGSLVTCRSAITITAITAKICTAPPTALQKQKKLNLKYNIKQKVNI